MQTFLPYVDFRRSAEVLDRKRLGKQRVECLQVLRGLTVPTDGWRHHPAVKMWRGYVEALGRYTLTVCEVWVEGGGADTVAATMSAELAEQAVGVPRSQAALGAAGALPPWLGDEAFHRSHRSALLRKDPDAYRPVFGPDPDDLPYVWPAGPDVP
ncbi:cytoplasmic protein [Nocardioides anomalus]|uniref:Cytoplasmic protein n=1 Tax=Nocardioides anomalus TaxID=2712223 RepID=A0A6G6WAA9_9ACTN|nr:MSMEG_6728 family protein [Nocardioides anomalus]QIG42268.1 cytoplasmic protein [Nocardioides anomalus]